MFNYEINIQTSRNKTGPQVAKANAPLFIISGELVDFHTWYVLSALPYRALLLPISHCYLLYAWFMDGKSTSEPWRRLVDSWLVVLLTSIVVKRKSHMFNPEDLRRRFIVWYYTTIFLCCNAVSSVSVKLKIFYSLLLSKQFYWTFIKYCLS